MGSSSAILRHGRAQFPSSTTRYPRPMPLLNIRRAGDGPRCYAVWLDTRPVFLDGLDGLLRIGDRFEVDGKGWRVVEVSYLSEPIRTMR